MYLSDLSESRISCHCERISRTDAQIVPADIFDASDGGGRVDRRGEIGTREWNRSKPDGHRWTDISRAQIEIHDRADVEVPSSPAAGPGDSP